LTSRILVIIIWVLIALFVVAPGWRMLWQIPLLGNWLNNRIFPDLQGKWTVSLQSNWPIVAKTRDAAKSKKLCFDPLKEGEGIPDFSESKFEVQVKQSWFRTDVEFMPNKDTPLLTSETLSVEFFKNEKGKKSVLWIFKQTNKEANGMKLAHTDEKSFYGAAKLDLDDDATTMTGHYWQNRSWRSGLNAAGLIVLQRA